MPPKAARSTASGKAKAPAKRPAAAEPASAAKRGKRTPEPAPAKRPAAAEPASAAAAEPSAEPAPGRSRAAPEKVNVPQQPFHPAWCQEQSTWPPLPGSLAPVAAGGRHSLFIDEEGHLRTCGIDRVAGFGSRSAQPFVVLGQGPLAEGEETRILPSPTVVPGLAEVRAVAAGQAHSAVVAADGSAYTFGNGYGGNRREGRLGHGDDIHVEEPRRLAGVDGARAVAVGERHTLILKADGAVLSCGVGVACGHGFASEAESKAAAVAQGLAMHEAHPPNERLPRRIDGFSGRRVQALAAGSSHSLAVTEDGGVWSWGAHALGHGVAGLQVTPKRIKFFARGGGGAVVAAGSTHSLLLNRLGDVYSWGYRANGQLGHGGERLPPEALLPRKIEALADKPASAVAASDGASAVITKQGAYTFGVGTAGRLGHGDAADRLVPTRVEALQSKRISAVSLGSSHSLFVTMYGRVFGCGESADLRFGAFDPHQELRGRFPLAQRHQLVPLEIPGFRARPVMHDLPTSLRGQEYLSHWKFLASARTWK